MRRFTCPVHGGEFDFSQFICPVCQGALVGESAVPCGCDLKANHRCERHQRERDEMLEEAARMCEW